MPDASKVVVTAILLAATVLVGFALIDQISVATESPSASVSEEQTRDDVLLQGAGQKVTVANGVSDEDETVYKTTGYAVGLAGTDDSYIQSSENIDFSTDQNWTVSVWAALDSGAAVQQRTILSLDGRLVISYYPMQGNYSAWFYDEGKTNSYQVNVSTGGGATSLQNVMVRSNSTHLSIYRNNTVGDEKNVTGESIVDAPTSSANWHGRLEEIRTVDDDLNDSQRQEFVDSPVEQQPDLNQTARIMFDQPDRSTQLLLFSSGHIEQSNVTYSHGFDEQTMDGQSVGNDLLGTTDYIWYPDEPAIEPVAGGELDGAPVAYVTYTFDDSLEGIKDQIVAGLVLAGILPLLLMAALVLRILRDL